MPFIVNVNCDAGAVRVAVVALVALLNVHVPVKSAFVSSRSSCTV